MYLHRHIWSNSATAEALRIVRNVIYSNPKPLTVHEVYKLALQEPSKSTGKNPLIRQQLTGQQIVPKGPLPPHADHPVRSMSYLKKAILPVLAEKNEIEQVHTISTLTQEEIDERLKKLSKAQRKTANLHTSKAVWAWRPKAPQPVPKPKPDVEVFGKEVGVEEDWSHLNKRRQRAREESVTRDLLWLIELEKAREQALAEAP